MTKYPNKNDKAYQDGLHEIKIATVMTGVFSRFWDSLGQENIIEHLRHTPAPFSGTFMWIHERLQLDEINAESQFQRLLRITGKPDCGKSVLAALLYRQVFQKEQVSKTTTIFYAFNGRDAPRRSPRAALASLIKQLFRLEKDSGLQGYFYQR